MGKKFVCQNVNISRLHYTKKLQEFFPMYLVCNHQIQDGTAASCQRGCRY